MNAHYTPIQLRNRASAGFTLIELAMVLLIVSLIIGGLFMAFGTQFNQTKLKETNASLQYTKKALLNFVEVNGYMPCPDADGNGKEDRTSGVCDANKGTVPYQDIGLTRGAASDSWGNTLGYYVTQNVTASTAICDSSKSASYFCSTNPPAFNDQTPPTSTATDTNNLEVYDAASGGNLLIDQVSAVLVARNKNGKVACTTANLSADEYENCDGDKTFVAHAPTDSPFFDDQLMTITGYEIKRPSSFDISGGIPPLFQSKFKEQHKKLYKYLVENKGQQKHKERIIQEDAKLYAAEQEAYDKEACEAIPQTDDDAVMQAWLQGLSSDPWLDMDTVNGIVDLTQSEPNLKARQITSKGRVNGGDENNAVIVTENNLGNIDLGGGRNLVIVNGTSSGDIAAGDGDDIIHVCGNMVSSDVTPPPVETSPLQLNFHDPKTIEAGKKWRFEYVDDKDGPNKGELPALNNGNGVDAIVEVIGSQNAHVSNIDYTGSGWQRAFQPRVLPERNGTSYWPKGEYWVEMKVTFVKHGTVAPFDVPKFQATGVDIDGGGKGTGLYEFIEITDWKSYRAEQDTVLDLIVTGNRLHAEPTTDEVMPGVHVTNDTDPRATKHMVTMDYETTDAFYYRIGVKLTKRYRGGTGGIDRMNALYFDTVTYNNPQKVTVAGKVNTGGGNDKVLIWGQIDRPTQLGDGNNFTYVFGQGGGSSTHNLQGSNQNDNIAILGDIGGPGSTGNAAGLKLYDGDNSVRIMGDCYANILVGQTGDDLIIIAKNPDTGHGGNTYQNCHLDTNAGDDIIYVEDTLQTHLVAGDGNDFVVLHATDSSRIETSAGDDVFILETPLKDTVKLGAGYDIANLLQGIGSGGSILGGDDNDEIKIQGDVSGSVDAGAGDDLVRVKGKLLSGASISGGGAATSKGDALVLSSYSINDWNNDTDSIQSKISGFKVIEFNDSVLELN